MGPDLEDELHEVVRDLLGKAPDRIRRLEGGFNNIVVGVTVGGRAVLAKKYFTHPNDPRDRLGVEFGMLSFLWRHGVRCIPEPLAEAPAHHIGLYEFVEGRPLRPGDLLDEDMDHLVRLLGKMATLSVEPEANSFGPASDSAFSLALHMERVRARMGRFLSASAVFSDAGAFVRSEVVPVFEAVCRRIERGASRLGWDVAAELSHEERSLSPADHGFHNALRRPDGTLVFLDFEYAGWDDPAQMIGNACWQPAVPIPDPLRHRFIAGVLGAFGEGHVGERLDLLDPLLGVKWCLILLNEFLPSDGRRRAFAGRSPASARAEQLGKAKDCLRRVSSGLASRG